MLVVMISCSQTCMLTTRSAPLLRASANHAAACYGPTHSRPVPLFNHILSNDTTVPIKLLHTYYGTGSPGSVAADMIQNFIKNGIEHLRLVFRDVNAAGHLPRNCKGPVAQTGSLFRDRHDQIPLVGA